MKYFKHILFLLLVILVAVPANAQHKGKKKYKSNISKQLNKPTPETIRNRVQQNIWVDSVMNTLSLDDRIGQLMMVRVPIKMSAKQQQNFEKLITQYHVGGVCFFAGTCADQLRQTKRYQQISPFPLLVALDAEWGLGMRLTDAYSFPRQMLMGALSAANDTLILQMANEVAIQCNKMGIHVNFAPVVDLNSNPLNPVIGSRSFGENKNRVGAKGLMYMKGLQNNNVIAVAKHFPGHGDTDVDSHLDLPIINHSKAYVDSVDIVPFIRLAKNGVRGVMVGHLQVNAYDNRRNMPATLSEAISNELLRKQVSFKGLVFTDGMDMKAVTKNYSVGQAELMALLAGADVLLLPSDVPAAVKTIKARAEQDSLFAQMINLKCRAILREKFRCGLNQMDISKLSVPSKEDYQRCSNLTVKIASKALTLVWNEPKVLPLRPNENVVRLAVGNCDTSITSLSSVMSDRISAADKVVIDLYAYSNPTSSKNYGASSTVLSTIRKVVSLNPKTSVVIYGSPYILQFFAAPNSALASALPCPAAVVVAYQDLPEVHKAVEGALWGKTKFEGVLPVNVRSLQGKDTPKPIRKPSPYERVVAAGMDSNCFREIDSIVYKGINQKAYPGCQLLVAYKGNVVYNRSYGRQTYDDNSPLVDSTTIYDLASLTKVTATTFAIMKLVDEGKIQLDDPLSRYLPYLKRTNKKSITVRQALSHIARLKAFDAYYSKLDNRCGDLSHSTEEYNTTLCEECRAAMMLNIAKSDLTKETKYLYSDFGFILLGDLVRQVSGQTLDIFMNQQFYQPMGLRNTTFCPRLHGFDTNRIAPTENDTYYRHRLLRGEVHDQNAAAMGGVSGHAGLFSTATDIYQLYKMWLDGGKYNGKQILSPAIFKTFNHRYYANLGNRRALGYDKPLINSRSSHCAPEATQSSFGHTGFTGTMVWVDPDKQLVYIFLSNRVHPEAGSNKLAKLNIRTDIQSLIYQSITK